MPRRLAVSTLNASTVDILNVIRQNASYEYQSLVPEISDAKDIPRVGDVLYGYPALANQFLNQLVNRIALVRVNSKVFNNAYKELKKGYLEYGETVEEVFVNIAKAREFSAEKAEARELKRTLPDVRSAFHCINWRVQYPVTIQDNDLRMAFTSAQGVQDLIAKIVDSLYQANEYDEFLLFKYLLIKAVTHGKMYPVEIAAGAETEAAVSFRGVSNMITFPSTAYNASGVTTYTPRNDQYLFMDSMYNAKFDVNVLASAFNMEKADFMGHLKLVDDWTTFDNARFKEITAGSDMIEEVTPAELALMAHVKGILVDSEWFQVYDNTNRMSEQYVGSGLYWNYFYNVFKIVSSSPFSNAIVFVDNGQNVTAPASITATITGKDASADARVFTLVVNDDSAAFSPTEVRFVQTQAATKAGIAVHPYGAVIFPAGQKTTTLEATIGSVAYTAAAALTTSAAVGDTITLNKNV